MKNKNVQMLAEAGLMLALAQLLSYVKLWQMPAGGSVTLASMLPIILFSIRWGIGRGITVGVVFGVLQFVLDTKYSLHIVSLLFDYFVAFGFLGLAGALRKSFRGIVTGTFLGIFGRFACSVISGYVVFADGAPEGQHPLVYSIVYQGTYLLPEFLIIAVILFILYKKAPQLTEKQI